MNENLELFAVRIDKELKEKFKKHVKSEGRSLQWQVEQLILEFMKNKERK